MKEQLVTEITTALKVHYPEFKGVYFFGSQSRGNSTTNSDWDFAIVFDRKIDWKFKDEIRGILYDIMLKNNVVIDSHIYSTSEILHPRTPFCEIVLKEGVFYGT